jgi:hypothetical protein
MNEWRNALYLAQLGWQVTDVVIVGKAIGKPHCFANLASSGWLGVLA